MADIDNDFITRMKLIGQYGIAYDPEQRILSISGCEGTSWDYACGTTRIKESSEQIINAWMGNELGTSIGLVESAED